MACIRYSYTSLETVKPSGFAHGFLESIHVNTNVQNNDLAEKSKVFSSYYWEILLWHFFTSEWRKRKKQVTTLDILMKNCFSSNSKGPLIITLKGQQHRTFSQPQLLY